MHLNDRSTISLLTAAIFLCLTPAMSFADWEDTFDRFNQDNWTIQLGGLRLAEEPAPDGVTIRDGTVILDEPLKGVRLTSRRKFLYGTLEARVKINPTGYQYIGFMSRAPWGANSLMLMSEPGAWQFMRVLSLRC